MALWGILLALAIGISVVGLLGSAEGGLGADRGEDGRFSKATFAGGCFWCMQHLFDRVEGVVSTTVGYTGGEKEDPIYEEVCAGGTGHVEAIEVVYDPGKVRYAELLDIFWHNIDPTVKDRQFCDYGTQYRTAIFYHDEEQRTLAERSKAQLVESRRFDAVFTEIIPASRFYPAEEYHQGYYKKNPVRYQLYRLGCGRDRRLHELWGE
jgi:peptide-methionine (S)-S-oxide reductase